ncbi:hypothetical protein GAO09_19250 [Rhizobiales bacterium RZME27]|uniref:Uncharacterized protein n=1 Tax=Endobacterium cereale TaxID=2663029 RepID=A0A6A8AG28_9HYPH|nr:hypothetical protein [Endobacterium cereale]MEB2846033.1 hypothetical protein [Endobacterium cereale]MQY48176.1 hypothetical protein [Endobacterium cereale]
MMSLPAIVGISLGASAFAAFTGKNRHKPFGRRMLYFVGGFIATIALLIAVNFGLYVMSR